MQLTYLRCVRVGNIINKQINNNNNMNHNSRPAKIVTKEANFTLLTRICLQPLQSSEILQILAK